MPVSPTHGIPPGGGGAVLKNPGGTNSVDDLVPVSPSLHMMSHESVPGDACVDISVNETDPVCMPVLMQVLPEEHRDLCERLSPRFGLTGNALS